MPSLSQQDQQSIDLLTRSIVDKILRDPIIYLKSGNGSDRAEAISRLFGLDDGNDL